MKYKTILLCIALSAASFISGCTRSSHQATYIDSQGPGTLIVGNQVTITDFYMAADDMVDSMISSGVFNNTQKQRSILAISRIINDTREQFDTDQLVKKIRVALNQTGKVVTTSIIGLGGRVEDELAAEIHSTKKIMQNKASISDTTPDFTLSGKIIQPPIARSGNRRQNSYIFQLSLTDTTSGLALWEDEKTITKQYNKAAVSW